MPDRLCFYFGRSTACLLTALTAEPDCARAWHRPRQTCCPPKMRQPWVPPSLGAPPAHLSETHLIATLLVLDNKKPILSSIAYFPNGFIRSYHTLKAFPVSIFRVACEFERRCSPRLRLRQTWHPHWSASSVMPPSAHYHGATAHHSRPSRTRAA